MNLRRRITAVTVTMAIVFGLSASPLRAQFTPRKGGPVATPRVQFPVVEPKSAEAKPIGKWFLKTDMDDMVVELGADGSGKFNFIAAGKAYSMNVKLKNGELRLDYGGGMFLIYNAAFRDGKLVLTAGNLKENTELQLSKADVNPPAPPAPKLVEPAPAAPKVARKVIVEKGLHDAPRGPTPEPEPPADLHSQVVNRPV